MISVQENLHCTVFNAFTVFKVYFEWLFDSALHRYRAVSCSIVLRVCLYVCVDGWRIRRDKIICHPQKTIASGGKRHQMPPVTKSLVKSGKMRGNKAATGVPHMHKFCTSNKFNDLIDNEVLPPGRQTESNMRLCFESTCQALVWNNGANWCVTCIFMYACTSCAHGPFVLGSFAFFSNDRYWANHSFTQRFQQRFLFGAFCCWTTKNWVAITS